MLKDTLYLISPQCLQKDFHYFTINYHLIIYHSYFVFLLKIPIPLCCMCGHIICILSYRFWFLILPLFFQPLFSIIKSKMPLAGCRTSEEAQRRRRWWCWVLTYAYIAWRLFMPLVSLWRADDSHSPPVKSQYNNGFDGAWLTGLSHREQFSLSQ